MPRITRAQPMDALSAMSTVAGYKAVADRGQPPAEVLPAADDRRRHHHAGPRLRHRRRGGGPAGHRHGAAARGRRRGLRHAARGQGAGGKPGRPVRRAGAWRPKDAEAKTGYAKAQSEEFYQQQQAADGASVAAADVVITTALVPGQRAPVLITEEMVQGMRPGSVIVDLAAEQGGNCALTEPGQEVVAARRHSSSARINLPSTMPFHASQMYARTVTNLPPAPAQGRPSAPDSTDELTAARDARGRSSMSVKPRTGTAGWRSVHASGSLGRRGRHDDRASEIGLYIFILAGFLGYHVITRVPPLLHTPLMSATNAISGISLGRLAGGRRGRRTARSAPSSASSPWPAPRPTWSAAS